MNWLSNLFEAARPFARKEGIIEAIVSKYPGSRSEKLGEAELLLIFDGTLQKTWLIASSDALYCVIDKLKETLPRARWRIPKDSIVRDGSVVLPIRIEPKSRSSSYVQLNEKRSRLFSHRLFADMPIEQRIRRFLIAAFSNQDRSGSPQSTFV